MHISLDEVEYLRETGESWKEVGKRFGMSKEAMRSWYRRQKGTHTRKRGGGVFKGNESKTRYDYRSYVVSGNHRIAFLTDMHVPFHDRQAIELAVSIIRDFNPTMIIVGSDGVDFYSLSRWSKNPDRRSNLQDDLDQWTLLTREIQDMVSSEYIAIPGNHEARLKRWLWDHGEISSLRALELESVMGLNDLGIKMVDEVVFDGALVIKHGDTVRKNSGYSAAAELAREHYQISTLTGHTHRGGVVAVKTRYNTVYGAEGFCLCNLSPEYVNNPDWQHGTVLATVHDRETTFESVPFHSRNGRMWAMWRGMKYSS